MSRNCQCHNHSTIFSFRVFLLFCMDKTADVSPSYRAEITSKGRQSRSSIGVSQPKRRFWTKTSWLQLGYGIWVNMTVMGIGLCFGFPAVTIPQLRDEMSSIQITLEDEAWIVSILTLSSPIGSIMCGLLMDRYGRRLVLILCEIPLCFGWFYTGFAMTARDIIIGRVIAGIGLGMAITAPRAYITEITLPNMRGLIGALPGLFISIGLTIQAGLGSFLTWYTLCYICGSYTFIMMISNAFLPDTPYFLLLKKQSISNTKSFAKVNLRRFRSSKFNVEAELQALYDFRKANNIRSMSFMEQLKTLFTRSSCKPYGIVTIYIIFMQLAGVNVVIMWAVEMLEASKSSLNANLGNFILGLTRIVFGVLTSLLLFKVGRRVMALVSALGVGVVAIGLSGFLYVVEENSVLPLFIYMAYIAFATLGYYTLPFLMMFELLPLQIRGLMSGICISQLNLLMFVMNNCYPFMRQNLGLRNTMALFGTSSLLGALILYFILPETKGLTLQEIEAIFKSQKPLSSQSVRADKLFGLSKASFGTSNATLLSRSMSERRLEKTKSKVNYDPNISHGTKETPLKIKSNESGQNMKDKRSQNDKQTNSKHKMNIEKKAKEKNKNGKEKPVRDEENNDIKDEKE